MSDRKRHTPTTRQPWSTVPARPPDTVDQIEARRRQEEADWDYITQNLKPPATPR